MLRFWQAGLAVLATTMVWAEAPSAQAVDSCRAGLALKREGKRAEAVLALRRAVVLAPEYAEARFVLAWVLVAEGDTDGARAQFDRVVALEPHSDRGRQARAALERLVPPAPPPAVLATTPPDLAAWPGEALLQGMATEAQPSEGRLAVQATALQLPGQAAPSACSFSVSLLVGLGTVGLPLRSAQGGTVDLRDVQAGVPLSLAFTPTNGAIAPVRCAVLAQAASAPRPTALGVPVLPPDAARDPDGVVRATVTVPLVFPAPGRERSWSDTFLAPRGGGTRRHLGQDIMAPKMTRLVATFAGTVTFRDPTDGGHNLLYLTGDDGWTVVYMHINNDTPGTDDGKGGAQYAYAPGLRSGQRVAAGQHIAYVGDSGNAEETDPHVHFELHWRDGGVLNAASSLRAARREARPVLHIDNTGLLAGRGEAKLAGVAREVDAGSGRLVLAPCARNVEGTSVPFDGEETVTVTCSQQAKVTVLGDDSQTRTLTDLRAGQVIVVALADAASTTARAVQVQQIGLAIAPQLVRAAAGP
ncbi:MAG: peptidoglycan DD-metalloendopeptidase family protein [Armatimonadetes bacterium]|nr:peptidoglycan DD-metalloendopeptidase family protein [Armatimonadota bacterium]